MALNISVFANVGDGPVHYGAAAGTGILGAHSVLAASTASAAISGPCQLVLTPDEGQRVTLIKGGAPVADPPADGMKLLGGVSRIFLLGSGQWYLRWIAG